MVSKNILALFPTTLPNPLNRDLSAVVSRSALKLSFPFILSGRRHGNNSLTYRVNIAQVSRRRKQQEFSDIILVLIDCFILYPVEMWALFRYQAVDVIRLSFPHSTSHREETNALHRQPRVGILCSTIRKFYRAQIITVASYILVVYRLVLLLSSD